MSRLSLLSRNVSTLALFVVCAFGFATPAAMPASHSTHPREVKTMLQSSADDLGKPGVDGFYGHGRVNAARAVRMR